jgi:hypothetical protein
MNSCVFSNPPKTLSNIVNFLDFYLSPDYFF